MAKCWLQSPDDRPAFSSLVTSIDAKLTSMAGYLDFNAFNLVVNNNVNTPSETPIDTKDETKE